MAEISKIRQSDIAYGLIRHKIITIDLPPMSPINEQVLMEDLHLGRTPIREALQRLAVDGLVSIVPHRGIFVAEISLSDLPKIFELRMALEGLCARLAAERITGEQIAVLESTLAALDQVREGDFAAAIEIEERFHLLFYQAADNKFLADTLSRLHTLSMRLWWMVLERLADVRQEVAVHFELIPALKARDAQLAEALIQKHVAGFQQHIRAAL